MRREYDVIIVGAGPAGLECANQLKDSSFSVLVLDKNTTIGDKPCAGGITELAKDFDFPRDKTRSFSQIKIIFEGKVYTLPLDFPLRTISRLDLAKYQLEKIKNAKNIDFLKGTLVKRINDREVITSQGRFKFKYLVGADGANSVVRRFLGLPNRISIGMYYNIKEKTNDVIIYINLKKLDLGYIWVFPHLYFTNIGVGFNPKRIRAPEAKHMLDKFIAQIGYDFSESRLMAAPINYDYRGCSFGNIFLTGEAAGLTSGATGEGISFALISGREIGKKILNPNYKLKRLTSILKVKKRQERAFKLFHILPYSLKALVIDNYLKRKGASLSVQHSLLGLLRT